MSMFCLIFCFLISVQHVVDKIGVGQTQKTIHEIQCFKKSVQCFKRLVEKVITSVDLPKVSGPYSSGGSEEL